MTSPARAFALSGAACVLVLQASCFGFFPFPSRSPPPPPPPIRADTPIECEDDSGGAKGYILLAVVSLGAAAMIPLVVDDPLDNVGLLVYVLPVALTIGLGSLSAASTKSEEAAACKRAQAEQRVLAEQQRQQQDARERAWTLTKVAATAARGDDCAKVIELEAEVQRVDVEFHATVFVRDAAIARCLTAGQR